MMRRLLLVALFSAAVVLVPWTGYLAVTLPDKFRTHEWRIAWVGFDVALIACFALSAIWGIRRHRAAVPLLAATAALLCCDAWFDVLLDWSSKRDRWTSLGSALLIELPAAALLILRARAQLRETPVPVDEPSGDTVPVLMHLTNAELAAFTAEHRALCDRYRLRHDRTGDDTRRITLRFHTSPAHTATSAPPGHPSRPLRSLLGRRARSRR